MKKNNSLKSKNNNQFDLHRLLPKKNKNFVKRKIEENEEKKNTEKSTCKKKHEFIQRRIIRTESN